MSPSQAAQVPPALLDAARQAHDAKALARRILATDALLQEAMSCPAGLDAARWAADHDPEHTIEQVAALVAQAAMAQLAGAPAPSPPAPPARQTHHRPARPAPAGREREGYGPGWQWVGADLSRRTEALSESDRELAGEHAAVAVHSALDELYARCWWRPRQAAEEALAQAARHLVPASLEWLDGSQRVEPDVRSEQVTPDHQALAAQVMPAASRAARRAVVSLVLGPTDRNRKRNAHPGFLPTWMSKEHGWDQMAPAEFATHANYWLLLLCQVDNQRRLSDEYRTALVRRLARPEVRWPPPPLPPDLSPLPPIEFSEQMSLFPEPEQEQEELCA